MILQALPGAPYDAPCSETGPNPEDVYDEVGSFRLPLGHERLPELKRGGEHNDPYRDQQGRTRSGPSPPTRPPYGCEERDEGLDQVEEEVSKARVDGLSARRDRRQHQVDGSPCDQDRGAPKDPVDRLLDVYSHRRSLGGAWLTSVMMQQTFSIPRCGRAWWPEPWERAAT